MAHNNFSNAARRSWLQRVQRWLQPSASSQRPRAASMRPLGEEPYVGEINIFAGNFAPDGWAFCNGQLLSTTEYDTLFLLIGTTYGGDGQSTFALPDLRGRVPVGSGQRSGAGNYALGQAGGQESVTLTVNQLPPHRHPLPASTSPGTTDVPQGNVPADNGAGSAQYAPAPATTLPATALGVTGSSQPHSNIQPLLAVHYIIALYGIFPSQN